MSKDDLPDDWLWFSAGQVLDARRTKRLAIAVSGGGDSMACLDIFRHANKERGLPIEAVTLDHGLRAEAKEEIALVADYCAKHDIPHAVLAWDWDGTGNLQAKARAARYRLIGAWAVANGIDTVALGHTVTDVAETFLMRLARKSGVDGLAEMDRRFERDGVIWIRPLLTFERSELRDYLTRRGIRWAEDPSNDDTRFDRVKARQALKALAPLGIDAKTLSSVASNAAWAKTALDHYLHAEVCARLVEEDRGDLILPERTPVPGRDTPHEIHRRAMNAAVQWVSGADYPPKYMSFVHLSVAMSEANTHSLGGCMFLREAGPKRFLDKLRITREHNAVKDHATPTDQLWDGRWQLDGPHEKTLEIRALGDAVKDTPWRETGMPRQSLLASPSVWRGPDLVAAPVAGLSNGWTAKATGRGKFAHFLLRR